MKKRKNSLLLLLIFLFPLEVDSVGRKYEPEEGTFDRRKRIEIRPLCRLVKETIVPDDVICEYQSQKRGEKIRKSILVHLETPVKNKSFA